MSCQDFIIFMLNIYIGSTSRVDFRITIGLEAAIRPRIFRLCLNQWNTFHFNAITSSQLVGDVARRWSEQTRPASLDRRLSMVRVAGASIAGVVRLSM